MNKKSVKLLSLMLSAVMLVVAVPMGVMAASKGGSSVAEGLSSTESASDEVESTTAAPAEPTTKDEAESTTGSVDPEEPTSEVKPTQPAEEESSEPASEPVYGLMGDLDGDGAYTDADVLILNGYLVYLKMQKKGASFAAAYAEAYRRQYGVDVRLTGAAARAADVNGDGEVSSSDVAMLKMLVSESEGAGK